MNKRIILLIAICFTFTIHGMSQKKIYNYLALGDSYTIGESVPVYENFPYQAVQLLRKNSLMVQAPEIIAKTGWTTDELTSGINGTHFLPVYDMVSLLIGVNNQYRGRTSEEYSRQFEDLLKKAIVFAGGKADHVFVISIPDWGATPFAQDRDRSKITDEINAFNAINLSLSKKYKVHYVDITPGSREALVDPELVAKDKLHPSGKEYARWAALLVGEMLPVFK
jgi:lysophospholipase L1-like esterase